MYDGKNVYTFVNGENLNEFNDFIEQYPAVATFYGKGFDIPFIGYALKADMKHLHFDVCFLLKRLGYKGGLKSIENQLGLSRWKFDWDWRISMVFLCGKNTKKLVTGDIWILFSPTTQKM